MKKFLFLAAALLALGISTACADSDRPIDVAQLPQKAQQFIQKHFAGEKVALAKVERDFLEVRYEVIFTDGAKAEFYKDGEWKEVDCRYSSVPAAVVPAQIAQYVSGFKDKSIISVLFSSNSLGSLIAIWLLSRGVKASVISFLGE